MTRKTSLADILSARWLMNRNKAQGYYPQVFGMLGGAGLNTPEEVLKDYMPAQLAMNNVYQISEFGEAASPEKAPQNSVAIMQLSGVVTKNDQWCGGAGTNTKANLLERAIANPNIVAVVLQIDSGGGEAGAVEKLTEAIRLSEKPIVAWIDGMAASAAYWIASACDRIVMFGNNSEVGSIGAYVQFADFTKYYEDMGINIITIYAPQSTLKNKAFEDALKADDKAMKAELEELVSVFISEVKANRPELAEAPKEVFQGAMFTTAQAIEIGLADDKGTLSNALKIASDLANGNSNFNSNNTNTMKTTIAASNTALIAALGLTLAEGATSIEVELTAENFEAINKALADSASALATATTSLETAEANVTKVTGERDALQTRLNATPAAVEAPIVAAADNLPPAKAKVNPFESQADRDLAEILANDIQLPV